MDDLLDLDLSAPAAPSSSSGASGAKGPQAAYGAGKSSFDYLSQMRTNTPSPLPSRSASPYSPSSTSTASANGRLAPTPAGRPAAPIKAGSGAGDDAFSSLFGASPSSAQANAGGLSMAERLARESAAKIGGVGANGGTWTTLSPSSTGGSGSRSPSPALPPSRGASMNSATSPKPPSANPDPWDFDLLASAPPVSSSTKPKPSAANQDPFDLGFDTPPPSSRSPAPAASRSNGNASRNVLDDDDPFDTSSSLLGSSSAPSRQSTTAASDDFDLLGAFSKPAPPPSRSPAPAPSQPSRTRTPANAPSRSSTASPPPHVLGSLIEMGFSIPQSKAALVATASPEGGWNVEAALEALVEEQQVGAAQERRREEGRWRSRLAEDEEEERPRPRQQPRERERERDEPVLQERPATGRRAREAAAAAKAKAEAATAAQTKVQEQANELLAQASKIGFSMFKSANAYWEKGRESVKKVLDEAQEGGVGGAGEGAQNGRAGRREEAAGPAKGRPKWWTEDMVDDEEGTPAPVASSSSSRRRPPTSEEAPTKPPPTLFQDSDHESDGGVVDDVLPQRPSAAPSAPQRQPQRPPPPSQSAPTRPTPPAAAPPSAEYRSPWRRAKPSSATPSAPAPAPPRRTPTPPPARPPRPSVSHSPTALSASLEHKTTGNSHFKLGQFGDADVAYTKAIEALPKGSLALVPLLNNRAAARLRNGDERKAGEDAGEVIRILLRLEEGAPFTEPSAADLAALDAEVLPAEASDLSLRDQLGKALGKRAKANETNEKWKAALVDWETLSKGGEVLAKSGGGRKVISEGIARCRKMLGAGGGGGSAPPISTMGNVSAVAARRAQQSAASATPPRPRPAASASAPAVQGSGDAVRALQAASAAASAEEDLRLSLKDSVDARITAWKGGKEANLRALIASLENVLWPELEWKKVGMHELISEGQLKVRYVRAIGKVHPDKLNVNNTTVEQRMIAGGVFAGLNDAWNAQKA